MTATDAQVQNFVDSRIRPACMEILLWVLRRQNDKASIDDVYAALTQQNPTWVDNNSNNPAHLATPSDVLAVNTFETNLLSIITGNIATDSATALALIQGIQSQWPIIQKLPVVPPIP